MKIIDVHHLLWNIFVNSPCNMPRRGCRERKNRPFIYLSSLGFSLRMFNLICFFRVHLSARINSHFATPLKDAFMYIFTLGSRERDKKIYIYVVNNSIVYGFNRSILFACYTTRLSIHALDPPFNRDHPSNCFTRKKSIQ